MKSKQSNTTRTPEHRENYLIFIRPGFGAEFWHGVEGARLWLTTRHPPDSGDCGYGRLRLLTLLSELRVSYAEQGLLEEFNGRLARRLTVTGLDRTPEGTLDGRIGGAATQPLRDDADDGAHVTPRALGQPVDMPAGWLRRER